MSHTITVESGKTVRLPTSGKYCDRDIIVTASAGSFADGGAVYGAIEAKYPEGSVCSCNAQTSGKKLKAADTSGKVVFALPEPDTWLVEVEFGDGLRTQEVLIDNDRRCESVNLYITSLFFDGGNACDYSGGWHSRFGSGNTLKLRIHGNASENYDVGIYGTSNEQIDLTEFFTLIITVPKISGCINTSFYFADAPGGDMGIYAFPTSEYMWDLHEGENIINVAGLTGLCYFGFCIAYGKGSADAAEMEVSRIVGEK